MTARPSLSLPLYALTTAMLSPLAPWLLRARARRGREDLQRLGERLGHAGRGRPEGRLVWLHAVSVGEGLSVLPLVEQFRASRPDLAILVTSGTRASAEILGRRLPDEVIHQYAPVDTPGAVRRFIQHWRPDLAVFVESEIWPNLILAAKAGGARLALASGGMSAASYGHWRWAPAAARALLGAYDLVLARNPEAADRLRRLGGKVAGLADLKFGAPPLPVDVAGLSAERVKIGGRAVVLGASTHPGEDAIMLAAFAAARLGREPGPLLILAPRHVERGADIAALATAMGLKAGLRSRGAAAGEVDVYVADTLGEMGLWYSLAGLAVVGGSLVPGIGGHNPLEPARLGCPFVAGPWVERWPVYQALRTLDAARLVPAAGMPEVMALAMQRDPVLAARAVAARDEVARRDQDAHAGIAQLIGLAPR